MSDDSKSTSSGSSSAASTASAVAGATGGAPKRIRIVKPARCAGGDKIPEFHFRPQDIDRVFDVGAGENQVSPRIAEVVLKKGAAIAAS